MTNDHPESPPRPGSEAGSRSGSEPRSRTGDEPPVPPRSASEPPALTKSPFDSETFTSATFVTVGRGPDLALAAVWILARAGMLLLLVRDDLGIGGVGREVGLYQYWYGQFAA
ncbi:hypothetical protein ABZ318_37805, partial [Streptomyces sp. NPDC006197]